MKKVILKTQEEVKRLLPETLEKNLKENEDICPICHGLGIIKRNQPFGISEYNKPLEWYENEYFTWCPNCYFGVIKLCEFCGKPLTKGSKVCNCEGYKEHEQKVLEMKQQEMIIKAREVGTEEVDCVYDEKSEQYFFDLESFVDEYKELYFDSVEEGKVQSFEDFFETVVPKVLWVCPSIEININANSIIEDACEELHEDAADYIGYDDKKELQDFLNYWCEKQVGTTTYYSEYKKYISVRREWFDN